jgi:adenylate cyclase
MLAESVPERPIGVPNETSVERRLAAIFAADVVGYSRLMGADEIGTLRALKAIRRELADPVIAGHHGRVVKTTGDGILIEFPSVVDAVTCAIAIQRGMVTRNAAIPEDKRIAFRIGINVGDIIIDEADIHGDGVNVAARLEGMAEPGGICVSRKVRDEVRDKLDLAFEDLGEQTLKNIARPVRAFGLSVKNISALPDREISRAALSTDVTPTEPKPLTPPDKPSIAVLPFQNMSGDPEQEYFADGISEDIITALSKLAQLFVIARNSSFTFKGKNVHIGEVGKSLGVRYVLEGSVRKSGGRVRITAQLIDATTGGHLWAERFDRDLTDIFAVQDDVTTRIVAALALNLSAGDRQSIAAEHTDNLEAHDCFLRGRELWWLFTREGNREAETLLRRATELDPRFAPAFAFLAAVLANSYTNRWSASPAEALLEAEKAARQAVRLDERYPYALWSLAMTSLWARRHDEALSAAEKMIGFNPNFGNGHNLLGVLLHYVGRSEEAIKCFERAVALDPYFPGLWLYFEAQADYQLGRYPEAVGLLKRRILRNPDTETSWVLLAASYGQMGLVEEAREAWREALRINPDYSLEHRRKVLPYKNPDDFERVVDGLRKAGLPD